MRINKVHVDGQTFVLSADESIPALKQQIVAALTGGGAAFVDFDSVGCGLVSVLIAPNVKVRFEVVVHTEEPMNDRDAYPTVSTDEDMSAIDWFLEHP